MALTMFVPYAVSTYSSVQATRGIDEPADETDARQQIDGSGCAVVSQQGEPAGDND